MDREREKEKILEDANEPQKKKEEVYIFINEILLLKTAQFATNFWRNIEVIPLGAILEPNQALGWLQ